MAAKIGGAGMLLSSMGLPIGEIMQTAEQLSQLAIRIQAQLDRIENRLTNIERMLHDGTDRYTNRESANGQRLITAARGSGYIDGN